MALQTDQFQIGTLETDSNANEDHDINHGTKRLITHDGVNLNEKYGDRHIDLMLKLQDLLGSFRRKTNDAQCEQFKQIFDELEFLLPQ